MNILIVEDENSKYNDIISTIKENYACNFKRAQNPKKALYLMREMYFDITLLDMTLPFSKDNPKLNTMAGKELLFDMLTEEIEIPTIIVTRYSNFSQGENLMFDNNSSLTYYYNDFFKIYDEVGYTDFSSYDITTFEGMHNYLKQNIPFYVGIVFFTQQNNLWKQNLVKLMEKIK